MSSAVKLTAVGHVYPARGKTGEVHAVGPIDLELSPGEFFTIVGPSGCGKSTLLEIVAGLQGCTSGQVMVDGRQVAGRVPDGVGVVFQEDACFPWLTAHENIAFALRRRKLDRADVARRVDRVLDFLDLQDFRHAYPTQLSGGMRQRVCLGRILVLEPKLILLDEPFGKLDQQTRLLMGDEMLRLWRASGATIMLITHSLDEAALLSDRVGVMSARPGRFIDVLETGWPRERSTAMVCDPRYGELTARLWSSLRNEAASSVALENQA